MDSCGDSESDFPAGSHRDSKTGSRRDLQRDFREDFCGDLDAVARVLDEYESRLLALDKEGKVRIAAWPPAECPKTPIRERSKRW